MDTLIHETIFSKHTQMNTLTYEKKNCNTLTQTKTQKHAGKKKLTIQKTAHNHILLTNPAKKANKGTHTSIHKPHILTHMKTQAHTIIQKHTLNDTQSAPEAFLRNTHEKQSETHTSKITDAQNHQNSHMHKRKYTETHTHTGDTKNTQKTETHAHTKTHIKLERINTNDKETTQPDTKSHAKTQ